MHEAIEFAVREKIMFVRAPRQMTASSCGNIAKELIDRAQDLGAEQIRIDLSECVYLDSTIMGQFVVVRRTMGETGIEIVSPSPEAWQMLVIMGLDKLLPISHDKYPMDLIFNPLLVSEKNDADNVLQAHILLSSLSRENATRFDLLIKTLQTSLKKPQ